MLASVQQCVLWLCLFISCSVYGLLIFTLLRHSKRLKQDVLWSIIPFGLIAMMAGPATHWMT